MTFHEACQAIVDNAENPKLNWAVNYAKRGLTIPDLFIETQRTQALYILSNMQYWRGAKAKEVRATLNRFAKDE